MKIIDIIILIPLLWGAIKGFSKGLIIEVASLVALAVGIFVAIHFSYFITSLFGLKSTVAPMVGFIITFVLVAVAIFFLAKILEKSVDLLALGVANKFAGAFVSMLKFAFIISVLIVVVERIDRGGFLISHETRESSLLYKPVGILAPAVFPKLRFEELKKAPDPSVSSSTTIQSKDSSK